MSYDFSPDVDVFPSNIIQLIVARAKQKWPRTEILSRPLRHSDPTQSVGVYPTDWMPDASSYEFPVNPTIIPAGKPTTQVYLLNIQAFVKDAVEERGIKTHSVMSKAMRSLLYFDNPLAVGLRALRVEMDGVAEVIQKRTIIRQKYISNEINGSFLYLSTLQYQIETENK